MDEAVRAAMQRWPDVPAVAGWLSLDPRGNWRLHPQGDAAAGGPGEPITNPQILAFFARNYAHDDQGRWFVQNGPQRVYVRIDLAPLVLRTAAEGPGLEAHTGAAVGRIDGWWLDDAGRLFASTDIGPGAIGDRDLERVLEGLRNEDGEPAGELLADGEAVEALGYGAAELAAPRPFHELAADEVPARLGFVAMPAP